jgi:hypothetical protein
VKQLFPGKQTIHRDKLLGISTTTTQYKILVDAREGLWGTRESLILLLRSIG